MTPEDRFDLGLVVVALSAIGVLVLHVVTLT
jgi:hypothetical protein